MRKEGKRVSGTAMVATQSRFHRDRLDAEPIVSKALRLDLVPNVQVVALATHSHHLQPNLQVVTLSPQAQVGASNRCGGE
jgi:hypothetical protein